MEVPAIVITGGRRCGTCLLYRLLDGHPGLFNSLTEAYLLEYPHLLTPEARHRSVSFHFEAAADELCEAMH